MSDSDVASRRTGEAGRDEAASALFANLVIQQTNMALMLLGRVPNPETGERIQDFEAARMFIDTLEMIETKTKGNLDAREQQLLKQSLTTLRMAFVEAVDSPPAESPSPQKPSEPPAGATTPSSSPTPEEEHRKKFSKKY